MDLNRLKVLFPSSVKSWVKIHPSIANIVDILLNLRRREILPYTDIFTMMSANEREYLFRLARANDAANAIVEIGCYAGGSAYFLGKGAELSGSRVYSVDPFASLLEIQVHECDGSDYLQQKKPSKHEVEANLRRHGLAERVVLVEGFSLDVAQHWNMPIGLLFIDGNHRHVVEDYEAWKVHLAKGAVIAFHDTNYVNDESITGQVSASVEEIITRHGLTAIGWVDSITAVKHH